MQKEERTIFGVRKNIFLLGLTSLFNDFSSEMVYSIFTVFFTSVLKTGAIAIGVVDGVAEGLSNVFKIYSGAMSDRFQKRKSLVVWGYAISVFSRPLYLLAHTVPAVLGLRVADRVGKGLRDAPRDAIISLSAPKDELGFSFGFHRAMDTLGAILGPLAAFGILYYFKDRFDIVFITSFVVGLIALASLIAISDVVIDVTKSRTSLSGAWRAMNSQFKWFLVATVFLSVGSIPIAVLLLSAQAIHLSEAFVPLLYTLYNVTYAGFSITAGTHSDRYGSRRIIALGVICMLIAYAVIAVAHTEYALSIGFMILGLCTAFTDGVSRALASNLTSDDTRGSAMGLLRAASGLGALLAGVCGGYAWQVWGAPIALLAASAVLLLGLVALMLTRIPSGSTT